MNNLLFIVLFFSSIYSNDEINIEINKIKQGNYKNKISANVLNVENNEEHLFLLGLIEIDGEKSKNYMEEYYKTSDTKYKDQSIIKIAEYLINVFWNKRAYIPNAVMEAYTQ